MTQEKVSNAQHRYYRGVMLPILRAECGFERDEDAHKHNIAAFYAFELGDPTINMQDKRLPSMADMSHEEAGRFISYLLRIADEAGWRIPGPREKGIVNERAPPVGEADGERW
jgi:hypothetical protein